MHNAIKLKNADKRVFFTSPVNYESEKPKKIESTHNVSYHKMCQYEMPSDRTPGRASEIFANENNKSFIPL